MPKKEKEAFKASFLFFSGVYDIRVASATAITVNTAAIFRAAAISPLTDLFRIVGMIPSFLWAPACYGLCCL